MCIRDSSLTVQEDSSAGLSTDSSLKLQLADLWLYVMTDYPELAKKKKALKCLTVFFSTYLYETAFSLLTVSYTHLDVYKRQIYTFFSIINKIWTQ